MELLLSNNDALANFLESECEELDAQESLSYLIIGTGWALVVKEDPLG